MPPKADGADGVPKVRGPALEGGVLAVAAPSRARARCPPGVPLLTAPPPSPPASAALHAREQLGRAAAQEAGAPAGR